MGQISSEKFIKKNEIWITGDYSLSDCDLYMDIGSFGLLIRTSDILIGSDRCRLKINGKEIPEDIMSVNYSCGDILELEDYKIVLLKDTVEIIGLKDGNLCYLETVGKEEIEGIFFHRPPRRMPRVEMQEIELKQPLRVEDLNKKKLAGIILRPLAMAAFTVIMGYFLKRGAFVYMSIGMTLITMIFSIKEYISERKQKKQANEEANVIYREYLLKKIKLLLGKQNAEKEADILLYPTVDEVMRLIKSRSGRLYEKSASYEDFLTVALGYCRAPARVHFANKDDELDVNSNPISKYAKILSDRYRMKDNAPLSVSVRDNVGLIGDSKVISEQIKVIISKLTFSHSYHDLLTVMIYDQRDYELYSYMRWYPHTNLTGINLRLLVNDEQSKDQVLGTLLQIIKERTNKRNDESKREIEFSPHILFVVLNPELIQNHPIMEYLGKDGSKLGYSIIYACRYLEMLPENISTVCEFIDSNNARLLLNRRVRINNAFLLDHINSDYGDSGYEYQARYMAGIIHEKGVTSHIPENITFFDLYKINNPKELDCPSRWGKNAAYRTLSVPIGVRAEEDYVYLNLHEKAHGPHGLVAGTTGSGKSEIVQTYILSLAINYHPYEIGFLLIDYKGGGMANLFKNLPHLLGTITNLNRAESMRAMASIKSELARRQRIFGEYEVNHIDNYQKLFKEGKAKEPIPHLFIISDEFAELKKEQPDFMKELVSTARIGRSLGVHLILATQKPSGVVDDQIWTNSRFKLCLKVQSEADSKEMLKTPDAALITNPGRAYLQVGNNEIYELFQSAYSGALYYDNCEETEEEDTRVYAVNELGQGELLNTDLSNLDSKEEKGISQLEAIINYIDDIYEETVAVRKPWLEPLRDKIISPYLDNVCDSASFTEADLELPIGLVDMPQLQLQEEYVLDLKKNGHLLYMASSGYGKSMILIHIVLGLCIKNSVKNLNFYILDMGNSSLISLKKLPHVADYLGVEDTEKQRKLITLLTEEIAERKRKLSSAMAINVEVYNETHEDKLRSIILVIDNYDAIGELGDEMIAFVQKLAREGLSLGMYVISTLTRDAVMRSATKNNFKERIAGFNFVDAEIMSFIGRSSIKLDEDKPGRVLVKYKGLYEMQLYLPFDFDSSLQFQERLKEKVREICEKSTEQKAREIPVLPEVLRLEDISKYENYSQADNLLPVGITVDRLQVRYLDLYEEPALIVGEAKSGRTNYLKKIIEHTLMNSQIFVIDNAGFELKEFSSDKRVTYGAEKEGILRVFEIIEDEIRSRKNEYNESDKSVSFKDFTKSKERIVVVIDNIQSLVELFEGNEDCIDVLLNAFESGISLIVTSDTRIRVRGSALLECLSSCRSGLILGNIRNQAVFSSAGVREDNRIFDIGYYHSKGINEKLKLFM